MNRTALGVFSIALAALLLELNLIRVFDVLWYPNMAYMVITLAVFSFGLAGVFLSIKPSFKTDQTWATLALLTFAMAVCALLLRPAVDELPFDYTLLTSENSGEMGLTFFLIYLVICTPFFIAGLVLSMVFSHYAEQIRQLYFWDLIGAALGSILLIPLLPKIGTAGILYVVAALCVFSTLCFSWGRHKGLSTSIALIMVVLIAYPFGQDKISTFEPHMHKRAFKPLVKQINEGTWWDPISKINILNLEILGQKRKWVAYDGGTQTSYYYPFDGDYKALRAKLPQAASGHFWSSYVAISHYLKADTGARVLIIGSAGGQELKAALTYEAGEVDAIELVGTVVALGKTQYADYTGNIMNDPRANVQRGEGRSFIRSQGKQYDIIQMFSNHTSSSIAAGSGAMQANYLQTVDAYKEYFSHLSKDGILHINHHVYPKMVATASRAWSEMGRSDFRKHVLVADQAHTRDDLPTFLVKMSPWTADEVAKVKSYMPQFRYPVDPTQPETSFLSDDFFVGELPQSVIDVTPYRIQEPTDNQPFFNSLRKNLDTLPRYDESKFVNQGVSDLLNSQKSTGYPVDVMHLFITAGAALVFAFIFTLGPLMFANTGREKWSGKSSFVGYFCALGLGFIVFELVFIQIFMKVIGYPLYTYTVVLFTFLFGAGLGSLLSEKMRLIERNKIWVPFLGIAVSAMLVVLCQMFIFDALLEVRTLLRILFSIAIIFPLAFFLGMPFPMGILAIQHKPAGTVAWAWGLNGLFTVIGGVFCAIFAVYFGFKATLGVAVLAYLVAYFAYRNLFAAYQLETR